MNNIKLPYEGNSMTEHLGIKFISVDNENVVSEMPVDNRTCQPYGMLNGGASLALAEITAGYASRMMCKEGEAVRGIQISCNHVSSVPVGEKVRAVGRIIHKGKSTHIWNIDIMDSNNRIVSTSRVTNFILSNKTNK